MGKTRYKKAESFRKAAAEADEVSPTLPLGFRELTISVLLVAVVIVVLFPVTQNGFVNLDDPLYVTANPHVQGGFTGENLRWAFTNVDAGNWHPLTWLSHMLDWKWFGARAAGHHFTSLFLHAINSALVFLSLLQLTGAVWRSALVAALFAFHPLHIETLAWVADRKDVLAGFFSLLTIWTYGWYAAERTRASVRLRRYALMLGCYLGALMSKPTVITLPLILMGIDWWPLRRWSSIQGPALAITKKLIAEKLPLLGAALCVAAVGITGQEQFGALPGVNDFPVTDRLANALLSCFQYLRQLFWPFDLAVYYPYPRSFALGAIALAAVLGAVISAGVWRARRLHPELITGWLWYLLALIPVLGLVQIGGHARADRYTYLPLIGIFLLLVWGITAITRNFPRPKIIPTVLTVAALLPCAILARQQIGHWKSTVTLLEHTIAVTQENALAHNNLGTALVEIGRLDEAVTHWQTALTLMPNYAEVHNNLGAALGRQGRLDEALFHLREAVRLKPGSANTHCNLGDAYALKAQFPEALHEYETALKLQTNFVDARLGLAKAFGALGRREDAIAQYKMAIETDGRRSEGHFGLGFIYAANDRLVEAVREFELSLQLNPNAPEAHGTLGIVLGRMGRLDQAITELETAVRLKPDYAEAHTNLALARRLKAESQSPR